MKRVNHIVLDFENSNLESVNWSSRFIEDNYRYSNIFKLIRLRRKSYIKTNLPSKKRNNTIYRFKFYTEHNKVTTTYSDFIFTLPKPIVPLQKVSLDYLPSALIENKKTLKKFLSKKLTPENIYIKAGYLKEAPSLKNEIRKHNIKTEKLKLEFKRRFKNKLNKRNLIVNNYIRYYTFIYRKLYILKSVSLPAKTTFRSSIILNKLSIVNFIKKERLYTKLKYSRSPAYDIVSGGAAALLAGFIGFLISEKYGFELVDSGDFYYLFMYLVFFSFSFKPLLTSLSSTTALKDIFSIKYFLNYFFFLIKYFFRK